MKCPVCIDSQLVISERQSIEIDYCPSCRGVWLDRGELDKLIERSAGLIAPGATAPQPVPGQPYRSDDRYASDFRKGYYKKPKSWLSEIFD